MTKPGSDERLHDAIRAELYKRHGHMLGARSIHEFADFVVREAALADSPAQRDEVPRCIATNLECGQCELAAGHTGKHLAGYLMWWEVAPESAAPAPSSGLWKRADAVLLELTAHCTVEFFDEEEENKARNIIMDALEGK